ncbi:MAG: D-glycero-beta-D-manno-heptose 1-phosphate adenylyltransferase [Chitinophagales bacterium]|nr:D-glycero-beta-D-manno-heptose 1-phosphate adenylyltransferase [Chitinophagales bacterium]MDW8274210.1 D-glycero-beta-D-manno-heptose 1-phosphate adenylyltransferase [Chitinophagales bacterium]
MSKIFTRESIILLTQRWKDEGEKVVFTNGCFDVFHFGHLHLLKEAKKFGTKLIVALNSDYSIKKIKGACRPINKEEHRAALLEALEMVDAVVLFDEETPEMLIRQIIPHVLVKGADYEINKIAGASFVLEKGGSVERIPLIEGLSSSSIIKRLI